MKALTLLQPWASLLACGAKRVETRSWSTKHRGPVAIHAGLRRDAPAYVQLGRMIAATAATGRNPLAIHALAMPSAGGLCCWREEFGWIDQGVGRVLAIADLVDVRRIEGECVPFAVLDSPLERAFGDYRPGRFAWRFDNWQPLVRAVSTPGKLGLWEWDPPAG